MNKKEEMIRKNREAIKALDWELLDGDDADFESDQGKGIAPPPLQKPYPDNAELIDLVHPPFESIGQTPIAKVIGDRRSRRSFTETPLTMEELSFLLWATQGVREVDGSKVWTKRTVPSGGARQPFETYLAVNWVDGLEPGIYRYIPIEHKLLLIKDEIPDQQQKVKEASYGQSFVGKCAATFIWAAVPYRAEWRYSIVAHKDIAIEAGHVCQNLYLACEAIGAGACGIAAYDQKLMDGIIGVDGEDEFTVYLSPAGKINK